jgi:plasmid stability protein
MATLKIGLDDETYSALMDDAARHLRPTDWHVKAILRQALGLAFPYPADDNTPRTPRSAHVITAPEPAAASAGEGTPATGHVCAERTVTPV